MIELCADICRRNGIKHLIWRGDKSLIGQVDKQNMTVHRWFAAKACPGNYLYDRHAYIADEVNKRLGVAAPAKDAKPAAASKLPYPVRCKDPKVNIRQHPDIKSADVGDILKADIFTIIEEAKGPGAELWGKLKSGAGWVALDYFVKV